MDHILLIPPNASQHLFCSLLLVDGSPGQTHDFRFLGLSYNIYFSSQGTILCKRSFFLNLESKERAVSWRLLFCFRIDDRKWLAVSLQVHLQVGLARIPVQNLHQLLVFRSFCLTRAFIILKIEISLSKLLEPFFTSAVRYNVFTQSRANHSFRLSRIVFFKLKREKKAMP